VGAGEPPHFRRSQPARYDLTPHQEREDGERIGMGLLEGRVAIVTGAGHGIGRGHALELAKEGAKVVVNDLGTSLAGEGTGKDADLTVDLIRDRGGEAVGNYEDVADFDGAARLVAQAVEEFGRLDILVNNAGISRDATIWKMTEDDWDRVIRVHLKGTFAPTHHAVRHWRERSQAGEDVRSGRIINTTSGAGLTGNFGQANYTTAKAGIAAFTMTVSLEVFKMGVTCNAIGPAGATRMAASIPGAGIEAREPDEFTEWDPMDPSLSSPVVAWLASDQAAHGTGQVIRAVKDEIVLMQPWSNGPSIGKAGRRWEASELTALVNADIFRSRAPGLRY
jgi:NAD(P)-dependent dehydrogenase (short-subunit alcohol dehydrogenase family)